MFILLDGFIIDEGTLAHTLVVSDVYYISASARATSSSTGHNKIMKKKVAGL